MKINFKSYLAAMMLIVSMTTNINAQGCSDAGFCSVGNGFKSMDVHLKNNFEVGAIYGIGEEDVTVYSQYASYTRNVNTEFSMSLKLTSQFSTGNFGTNGGLGDAYVSGNYNFKLASKSKLNVLMGFKIPLNSANEKIDGTSLPMDYQSSLGTFDWISGVSLTVDKWDFNIAYQLPLTKYNKNSYLSEYSGTDDFQSTNLFGRKSDGLFRTTYTIKTLNNKFTFKPNVLAIYHFGEDTFENIFGVREKIDGSNGLTLNANVIASYKLGTNSYLETSIAAPLVVREARPDGLTRALTIGLAYKVNF
jgi:hypothetical protein